MEGKLTPEQYREMTGRDPYQQFVGRRRDQDLPTEQDIQRATDRLTAQLDAALETNRVTGAGEAREGLSFEGWWADMSPEFDVDPDYPLTDDHRGMALAGWEARDAEIADLTHQIETYRQNATESTGIVARQTLELSELRKALAAAEREAKVLREALERAEGPLHMYYQQHHETGPCKCQICGSSRERGSV